MALSAVEPKSHFVEVSREVFGANTVPRSDKSAFEKRERRFDRVRRDHETVLVPDVFFGFVVDRLPLGPLRDWQSLVVEHGFVGHDHVHVFTDVLLQQVNLSCVQ